MTQKPTTSKKLNPFAFPAETTVRFMMIIVASASIVWSVATFFGNTVVTRWLSPTSNPDNFVAFFQQLITFNQLINQPSQSVSAVELQQAANLLDAQVKASQHLPTTLLVFSCLLLLIAFIIYSLHPNRQIKSSNLIKITPKWDPKIEEEIDSLRARAGVSKLPTLMRVDQSNTIEGQVFGFPNRYLIALGGGMRMAMRRERAKFDGTILHEFAHIINRDIGKYFWSGAIWAATIISAAIPWLIYLFSTTAGNTIRALQSGGTDNVNWDVLFLDVLPANLLHTLQFILLLGMLNLIRKSLLRTRELYADWRVASWGAQSEIRAMLDSKKEVQSPSFLERLRKNHPTLKERNEILDFPNQLFQVSPDLPFLAGALTGVFVAGMTRVFGSIYIQIRGGPLVRLAKNALQQQTSSSFVDISDPAFQLLKFISVNIGQRLFLIAIFLFFGYLIAGTVGVQIQRLVALNLSSTNQNNFSYISLLRYAALMSLGLQIALLITPLSFFSFQDIFWIVLLFPVGFIIFTSFNWLWLIVAYIAFKNLILRSYSAQNPPRRSLRRRTLFLSALYSFNLLVGFLTQLAGPVLSNSIGADALFGFSGFGVILGALVGTVLVTFLIYLFAFGLIWLSSKLIPSTSSCRHCAATLTPNYPITEHCPYCDQSQYDWLFIE